MNKSTKTWITIVAAILVVIVMLGAAAIGGGIYFISSHVRRAAVEEPQAGERFARARERLASRSPLLSVDGSGEVVVNRALSTAAAPGVPKLQTLHAMVYEPDEGRVVEIDLPFWLLRVMPAGGRFSFLSDSGLDVRSERINLTVDDLERHGPGLVMDHRDRRGGQVLVWTE